MKTGRIAKTVLALLLTICMFVCQFSTVFALEFPVSDGVNDDGSKDVPELSLSWSGFTDDTELMIRKADPQDDEAGIFDLLYETVDKWCVYDVLIIEKMSGGFNDPEAGGALTIHNYSVTDRDLVGLYRLTDEGLSDEIPYIATETDVDFVVKELGVFVFVDKELYLRGLTDDVGSDGGKRGEPLRDGDSDIVIEMFRTVLRSGASKNDAGDYVWTPPAYDSDHDFIFRMSYSSSGMYDYEPGKMWFRIPAHILIDRTGSYADIYSLSIPSYDSEGLTNSNVFVYREDIDPETGEPCLIIYNRISCPTAQSGYVEVAYSVDRTMFNYADYDPDNTGVANGNTNPKNGSDPFEAVMHIERGETVREATVDPIRVHIDTHAEITSIDKRTPTTVVSSWNNSWGAAPADAGNYYYVVWEIASRVTNMTQPYDFSLVDNFTVTDGEVVGYKMQGQSVYTSAANGGGIVRNVRTNYPNGRYDYVLTRHKKSTYDPILASDGQYTLRNSITGYVHPFDGVDADTNASSSRSFTYKPRVPSFSGPAFSTYANKAGNQHRYTLEDYYEGSIDSFEDMHYSITFSGNTYKYTVPEGHDESDPANYGIEPVNFEVSDRTLKLAASGMPTSESLTYNEYQIDNFKLSYTIQDAEYDEDNMRFRPVTAVFGDDEVIRIYGEFNNSGAWERVGDYYLKTHSFVATSRGSALGVSMSGDIVSFANNDPYCTGVRVVTANSHYSTILRVRPSITLKRSDLLTQYANAAHEDGSDEVRLLNSATGYIRRGGIDSISDPIVSRNMSAVDYLIGLHRNSEIKKIVTGYRNDVIHRIYSVNWNVSAREYYMTDNGEIDVEQESGRFYDLAPVGTTVQADSIVVYANGRRLASGNYTVELVPNYRDSGRTLIVININTSGKTYRFTYTTAYSWDSIAENGHNMLNSVAYETGNNDIGGGYPDDGGAITDKLIMTDLDPDTDANKFIYTSATHIVRALTAGSLGLRKQILSASDSDYSYETTVYSGEDYSYHIRFASDDVTLGKDLIIMDSLENFTVLNGPDAGRSSDWRGVLRSIDTSVARSLGIAPVVWYSTVNSLSISGLNVDENYDFSAHPDIWVRALSYAGDMSAVKAFAVDLRKTTNGEDYILPVETAVAVTVYMHAPESLDSAVSDPCTFNNIYLYNSVMSYIEYGADDAIWESGLNHQEYTKAHYRTVGTLHILKVDADDHTLPVSNTVFRLWGTSVYGTDVDMTMITNAYGLIDFTNVERGTYSLQEVDGADDYLQDHVLMTVTVDKYGDTWIGMVVDNGGVITYDYGVYGDMVISYDPSTCLYTLGNEPRVHGGTEFVKMVSVDGTSLIRILPGVTFKLSGTSDYGNDVLMTLISDENGVIGIDDIELGEYELIEISVPTGVTLSHDVYIVSCGEDGVVSVKAPDGSELPLDPEGRSIVINEPLHSVILRKYDPINNASLGGAVFELTGVSDNGTPVSQTVTSLNNGLVTFAGLEKGSYVLREITPPAKHQLDTTARLVRVFSDGSFIVDGLVFDNEYGWVSYPNDRFSDGIIEIVKHWSGDTASDRFIPTVHLDGEAPVHDVSWAQVSRTAWRSLWTKRERIGTSGSNYKYVYGSVEEIRRLSEYPGLDTSSMTEFIIDDGQTNYYIKAYLTSDWKYIYWESDAAVVYFPEDSSYLFSDSNGTNTQRIVLKTVDLTGWSLSRTTNTSYMFYHSSNSMASSKSKLLSVDVASWDMSHVTNMQNMFFGNHLLTSLDVGNWNVSNVTNMASVFAGCTGLTSLDLHNWDVSSVTTMNSIFSGCSGLTSLNLSGWDVSSVRNMGSMFHGCSGLTDFSFLDTWSETSSLTDMSSMFYGCTKLTDPHISDFDTSDVTTMHYLFYGCTALVAPNIGSLDTGSVTDMGGMFRGCSKLTTPNVSGWDTSSLTDAHEMFYGCSSLTAIDLNDWDTHALTNVDSMFENCSKIVAPQISGWNTQSLTTMSGMFKSCSKLTTPNIGSWDTSHVTDMSELFYSCTSLVDPGISGLDVHNVTTMASMFRSCSSLVNPGINNWITSSLTNVSYMYAGCTKLTTPCMNTWDMSHVTNFSYLFSQCSSLVTAGVGGWDTSSATNMSYVFSGCTKLVNPEVGSWNMSKVTTIARIFANCQVMNNPAVGNWNTSNVTNMNGAFAACYALTTPNVSGWNTAKVTDMSHMFGVSGTVNIGGSSTNNTTYSKLTLGNLNDLGCRSLTSIDLSSWNTAKVTNMSYMFSGCTALTSVHISNFSTTALTDMSWMFAYCTSLTAVDSSNIGGWNVSKVTTISGIFAGCSSLTTVSLNNWNLAALKTSSYVFAYCTTLVSPDVSSWNMSKVTTMAGMFAGAARITSFAFLGSWNTAAVTNMDRVFEQCRMTSIDLSGWNVSKVTNFRWMFANSPTLASIDLSAWSLNTSSNMLMTGMFQTDTAIVTIDLSGWNTTKMNGMAYMFSGCSRLTTIYVGSNWKTTGLNSSYRSYVFSACTSIVGGAGTTFVSSQTNYLYARVDNPPSAPGYLTLKTRSGAMPSFVGTDDVGSSSDGSFTVLSLNPMTGEYEIVSDLYADALMSVNFAPRDGGSVGTVTEDLTSNAEMYTGDSPSTATGAWIDNGNGTWTYRFNVYDDYAQYYIWESAMPGYRSDTDADHPLLVTYTEGGVLVSSPSGDARVETVVENGVTRYVVHITNTKIDDNFASMSLRKIVAGTSATDAELTKRFNFTIRFYMDASHTIPSSIGGVYGDVDLVGGEGTVALANGQRAVLTGLPGGLYYEVIETDADTGRFVTTSSGSVGQLPAHSTAYVTFTNTVPDLPLTGGFDITKTLVRADGQELTDADLDRYFMFDITLSSPLNGPYGSVIFTNGSARVGLRHGDTVAITGLPEGVTYTVTEESYGNYTSVGSGTTGTVTSSAMGHAAFVNTKPQAPTNGFVLQKRVDGPESSFGFTFSISFTDLDANVGYTYIGADGETSSFTADSMGAAQVLITLNDGEQVEFSGLPIGAHYTVTESASKYVASYVIDDTDGGNNIVSAHAANSRGNMALSTETETLDADESVVITFTNTGALYDVGFLKRSTDGALLEGALLRVLNARGEVAAEWRSTGEEDVIRLPAGSYRLVEAECPIGYVKAPDVLFTVDDTGVVFVDNEDVLFVEMVDPAIDVSVAKVDGSGHLLAGAKLRVCCADGTPVATWYSSDVPYSLDGLLSVLTPYFVTELEAPNGYALLEDNIPFIIDADGTVYIDYVMSENDGIISIVSGTAVSGGVISVINDSPASLTLSKTVEGNMGNKSKMFEFTITIAGLNGEYMAVDGSGHESTVTFTNGFAVVYLSHGEQITILNLPYGSAYTVAEVNYAPYTCSMTDNGTGVLDGDKIVAVTNELHSLIGVGVSLQTFGLVLVPMSLTVLIVMKIRRRRDEKADDIAN